MRGGGDGATAGKERGAGYAKAKDVIKGRISGVTCGKSLSTLN